MSVLSIATAVDWLDLLKKSRKHRELLRSVDHHHGEEWETFFASLIQPNLSSFSNQLQVYCHGLSKKKKVKKEEEEEEWKQICLGTRNSLRFMLSCLSAEDAVIRRRIQIELVVERYYSCHVGLCRVLSLFRKTLFESSSVHGQIRLLAARCLCNIVTQNTLTSTKLLDQLAPEPNAESVRKRLACGTAFFDTSADDDDTWNNGNQDSFIDDDDEPEEFLNWLDMLLSGAMTGNRDVLSAVLATIYNSLILLLSSNSSTPDYHYIQKLCQSSLFVSTLLRHVIPWKQTTTTTCAQTRDTRNDNRPDTLICDNYHDDEASFWITNLLLLFLKHGYMPMAYRAIGPVSSLLPEQVTLLFCLRAAASSDHEPPPPWATVTSSSSTSLSLFFANPNVAMDCLLFLAHLYSEIRLVVVEEEESDNVVKNSMLLAVIDLIAYYLGGGFILDDSWAALIRERVGTTTQLIPQLGQHLAQVYDSVAGNTGGRQVTLTQHQQETLICLVRAIGNLVFQCRINQDLIRTTPVPNSRSAFHVLLSTTSLSHSCFTLREWSLVAIRYLVETNEANQLVLAELEAQQAVQSTEFKSMGVTVDLDSKGNVKVVPSTKT